MSEGISVRMAQITQDFGPVRALDHVDFSVAKGTIHALVGENGAGKTTLMRILYGAQEPTSGEIFLDDQRVFFSSPADALKHGVGMVSQHYAVIPELSALENLMLGAEGGAILDRRRAKKKAEELAETMGFSFEWDKTAAGLGPAGAQKLEILKLLWRAVEVMILDEPTAMLSPEDSDALYASLRSLVSQGKTVIVVTHRLSEVTAHCDHVTVLRQGKFVADFPVGSKSQHEIAELIVGKALTESTRRTSQPGQVLLDIQGLKVHGDRGDMAVAGADLCLRSGEVVGVAGVDGSGQRELVQAILGVRPAFGGHMATGGVDITKAKARERIEAGLRGIPEDRHEEGVLDDFDLVANATLGHQRLGAFRHGPMVDKTSTHSLATDVAMRFDTRHAHLGQKIKDLSGGNQQRFVNARALAHEARVVIAFQPARGLDIEATRRLYAAFGEFVDQGGSVLVISFDLDELLEYCDRVVVMHKGHIASPATGTERDRGTIGAMMVGAG